MTGPIYHTLTWFVVLWGITVAEEKPKGEQVATANELSQKSSPIPEERWARIENIRKMLLHHFGAKWKYLEKPVAALRKTDEVEGLKRELYSVRMDPKYAAPVCILIPEGTPPFASVLVFHGGDGGLDVCCGPGLGRSGKEHYHHNMSLELTKAGFLTITVSIRGMGREAQNWGHGDCGKITENRDDFVGYTIFRGSCAMNVWTHDGIKIVDAILEDKRIDASRLAVAGISTGGELALYLGALDGRIAAVCSHGALVSYEDIYTKAHNWTIHAIPGAIGDFDMGDAAIACCPRPIQIQVGEKEPEFWGRHRPSTITEYKRIEEFYEACDASSELRITPKGGHAFDTAAAVEFLRNHIGHKHDDSMVPAQQ